MKTKKCTKCGIEKPLTEFSKDKSGKDGLKFHCKACVAEYRSQNRERLSKYNAEYYSQNKEKALKRQKEYYSQNKEKILKQQAEYRSQNKERISKRKAEYRSQNKERISKRKAEYRSQNKEKISEYYSQNKEKILKQSAEYHSKRNSEQSNCVYQIENSINERVYIGETIRGELRWKQHLRRLRGNYHRNKLLQEDFNKYGEEAFEWTILKEFESEDKDALLLEEARTIQRYIQDGIDLYNLMLTVDQLKMLEENKDIE